MLVDGGDKPSLGLSRSILGSTTFFEHTGDNRATWGCSGLSLLPAKRAGYRHLVARVIAAYLPDTLPRVEALKLWAFIMSNLVCRWQK